VAKISNKLLAIMSAMYRFKKYFYTQLIHQIMIKNTSLLLCIFLIIGFLRAEAQIMPKDSAIAIPLIIGSYAYQFPEGHLKQRFGSNSAIGGMFLYKTKKNWVFGLDGSFLFSQNVKEVNLFRNIATSEGMVIQFNGMLAEMRFFQRGILSGFKAGKIFPAFGPNLNSGIMVLGGGGFLQHKIRIENPGNQTPQIHGDYKKGYDRLTNGFAASGFLGYMYLSNNRLYNFFAGIEFVHAWTQSRRDIDFDTMKKDETKRRDMLYGAKVGWIIPIYKKMPQRFYYY
jgi:hypothetical protein